MHRLKLISSMGGADKEESLPPGSSAEACSTGDSRTSHSAQSEGTLESNDKSLKKARYVWQIKGNYHLKCPNEEKATSSGITSEETTSDLDLGLPSSSATPCIDAKLLQANIFNNIDSTTQTSETECPTVSAHKQPSPVWYRPRPDWPVFKWQTRQVAKAFVDNTINCVLEDMGCVPLPGDTDDFLDEAFSPPSSDQNNGNLEDEAVLMAIQSHGLQRSDQDNKYNSQRSRLIPSAERVENFHCENSDLLQIRRIFQKVSGPSSEISSVRESQVSADTFSVFSKQMKEDSNCAIPSPSSHIKTSRAGGRSQIKDGKNTGAGNDIDVSLFRSCTCPIKHNNDHQEPILKPFHQRTSDMDPSIDEKEECNLKMDSCCDTLNNSASCRVTCSCSLKKTDSFHKRKSQGPILSGICKKQCLHEVPSLQLTTSHSLVSDSSVVAGSSSMSDGKPQSFEHFDFIDAAVAAAIQKKGLSALSCTEYG